jgi:hypothetical protein
LAAAMRTGKIKYARLASIFYQPERFGVDDLRIHFGTWFAGWSAKLNAQ